MFLFPSLGSIWYRSTNQFRKTTATIKRFISTTSSRIAAKLNASLHMPDKNTRLKLAFVGNDISLQAMSLKNEFAPALTLNVQRNFIVTSSTLLHGYPRTGRTASGVLCRPFCSRWVMEPTIWLPPVIKLIKQIQTSTARAYSIKIAALCTGLSNTQ